MRYRSTYNYNMRIEEIDLENVFEYSLKSNLNEWKNLLKEFLSSLYLRKSDANDKQSYREKNHTRQSRGSPANKSTITDRILQVKVQHSQ